MHNRLFGPLALAMISASLFLTCTRRAPSHSPAVPQVEEGVSQMLAAYRKKAVQRVQYRIQLEIPTRPHEPIRAREQVSFQLTTQADTLQLDFKAEASQVQAVRANGKPVPVRLVREHLLIAPQHLQKGANTLDIQFTAGDLSLNRNDDFLYTLLVPDRARTLFPCFDQPDLKAVYELTLTTPNDWVAMSNAPLQDSAVYGDHKRWNFQPSDTLPTYLFSLVAGKFETVNRAVQNRSVQFHHRETDAEKMRLSMDPIFDLHRQALAFMEEYTQLAYPFRKFGFTAIPDFQYGGMEHVGAIDYKASALFLDESATKSQQVARSSLIAHETAHMWFGDLVTMAWFNDVWMKEVFANLMADKITQRTIPDAGYDLKFLLSHFPAAYRIDRTPGANPIRQPLGNLKEAGTLYGGIIYHKAPIMMRQLELLMGESAFRSGLGTYLKKYAYGNASWPDLIRILDDATTVDLQAWNQVWVNETGRPRFSYTLEVAHNKISRMRIRQQAEDGSARVWPQRFEVGLVYPDRMEELTVEMRRAETILTEARGKEKPQFIVFNTGGQGYGLFPIDTLMYAHLYALDDVVGRAAAYINLYEHMLNAQQLSPKQLMNFCREGLRRETEELNLKLLADQLSHLFWQFTTPDRRKAIATSLEADVWQAMAQPSEPNHKKILFQTYQQIATTPSAQERLLKVWEDQQPPAGMKLSEDDYTALAIDLAIREHPEAARILQVQLKRITNPDRQKRLAFMLPALSSDERVRDAFSASLKEASNREKEAWVVAALGCLHHPLRAAASERYLPESLALLEEIQQTGDIFFPQNWLEAIFSSYQSPAAAQTVRNFLKTHPGYNPRLRAKILQASDDLFRAEKILYPPGGG